MLDCLPCTIHRQERISRLDSSGFHVHSVFLQRQSKTAGLYPMLCNLRQPEVLCKKCDAVYQRKLCYFQPGLYSIETIVFVVEKLRVLYIISFEYPHRD